ncbi:DNA-directed RNA polymerases ii 24 kda polypeptide [Kockovaella imperatae]|uniref:DNA-directed RNA polymerases I, II, and III subunit RPABC1 n=1 Tax=Kockovaella imperatae TaxID=4999 RepID=A0A1Y1UT37_9TREE|nr:DNA-directed RNA polymerases ii 24 kda polypeptide [Kockovaella imperatae]ORX41112.1 DNA-directed RNA polymerases ii 24 kda polypeptide [Kockovaella imperatae]
MQELDRELARLWRVSRTVHEMMRDRGYQVADYEINTSFDDFKQAHGSSGQVDRTNMSFTADHEEESGNRIYVYFCSDRNVSKANVKTFLGSMDRMNAQKGLLIYAEKLSPIAARAMQEMSSEYHLEHFKETDLLVNITHHFLVPKHTIMKTEDKQALIKKYRLKETQLPRIMITDPVARYYGLRRGQVMKIERASETAGRYVTYRICM